MSSRFLVLLVSLAGCLSSNLAGECPDSPSSGVVICYYNAGSNSRSGLARFGVDDLPTDLCTHIVWSFIGPSATGEVLILADEEVVEEKSNTFEDFAALKEYNPEVKLMVSMGGWNAGSDNFTIVVNNETLRQNAVENLKSFLDEKCLDGLDLDWEYPAQRGSPDSDKELFGTFVKELKAAFEPSGYLLTAAVAVTQEKIDLSYDVAVLNEYLDYISLMNYDYHGTWDDVTGVNAPLYAQLTDDPALNLNVNNSVYTWLANGADASKMVIGLGAYGKTFTLTSLDNTGTGAPFTGAGIAGPYTGEAGTWGYFEICSDQMNNSDAWNITEVPDNYVFANKDLFWVGYDNPDTIYAKAQYAKKMGLAGIMYWSVDQDDFHGLCGPTFPLISQGIAGYNSDTWSDDTEELSEIATSS